MSSAFTTAPPPSNSAPASMETLLATIGRVVAKFEARLEAQEWRRATAFPPSRSEFDLPFGRPRTSWDPPEPPQKPAYSESYGGGDGYSNNYNAYHNNEPQAWFYNTYEPPPPVQYYTYESDRYNYVSQPVQYEPPPTTQYYSVVEPPQQLIGFRQPSHALQQLLPTQRAPWESPWYRTAPDSSAGDPQPEGCTEWQPMTSVYGLSTDSQQNAPSSVPVTSNKEDEFEKWQGEVREAETRAEVEIEAGLDTKTEDEFVSGVVKTEEEFVLDVDAMLEVGEVHACGSIKSSLPNIPLPIDGGIIEGTSAATRINSSISWLALRLQRYPVTTAFQKSSSQRRKMWYQDELWIDSSYQRCKLISGLFVPNVARGRIDLKFYALEEVYKDF